jgi:hypothetical protein
MNFEGRGQPIAVLKSKAKKRDETVLYYDANHNGRYPEEINLREMRGGDSIHFQILPTEKSERDVLMLTGKSGSGKSYYIKCYIIEYHKMHPKNPIWIISPKYDDSTFNDVKKYTTQLRMDDQFVQTDIGLEDLQNSLVIFDDIEGIMDKRLRVKVFNLLNLCMTTGRSYHISICVVSHKATNGKDTSFMLLENSHCVFFPSYVPERSLQYLCKDYLALKKSHIDKILKTNDRACRVLCNPRVVITDKHAFSVKR